MRALPKAVLLSVIQVVADEKTPLHRQIYTCLKTAILGGQLDAYLRLPSSRDMASWLGISRNTVLEALRQLSAEGYLETRMGSGTFVTPDVPADLLWERSRSASRTFVASDERTLSMRGESFRNTRFTARRKTNADYVFTIGMPALDYFPFDIWSRLLTKHYRSASHALLDYDVASPIGYAPLREAIAEYARTTRSVRCTADQVIITNGSQQAIFLASQLLLDPGDAAWMEDPGHPGTHWILHTAGACVTPVPVDEQGLRVDLGIVRAPNARLACVTPSLQFPIGGSMSLKRRGELLLWAQNNNAWIIEDDYNHEFRYNGYPLSSLQGLDASSRVLYTGTFSKSMFPSLRIGYLIVPPDLIEPFAAARAIVDIQSPMIPQAALNDFIREGHFGRHIRRARALYTERRSHLLNEIERILGDAVEVGNSDSGMHLVLWLPDSASDRQISADAEGAGIEVLALSNLYFGEATRRGLVLGYAGARSEDITRGLVVLREILRTAHVASE